MPFFNEICLKAEVFFYDYISRVTKLPDPLSK